jgi:hypothetical protein
MFSKKTASALYLGLFLVATPLLGQRTPLREGWNLFTPQQDIEFGRALAQDAEATLDWSYDPTAEDYINSLGKQLTEFAPGYKYPYEFRIFRDPTVQSFALPGGVIYVSSGLVLAAQSEPQLAGVLAHQIAHVIARHGTAEISNAYQGRAAGNRQVPVIDDVISQLNIRVQPGSIPLRYTAQEEAEADTIATQLLYDTRFDPQMLSAGMARLANQPLNLRQNFTRDHPAPANRAATVRRELQRLGPIPESLRGNSPYFQTAQSNVRNEGVAPARVSRNRTDPANARFVTYQGFDYEIRYPENWTVTESGSSVTIAPETGNDSGSIAYGVLIDTFQPNNRDSFGRNSFIVPNQAPQRFNNLSNATDQLVAELRRTNPALRVVRSSQKQVAGDAALEVEMTNESSLGGREINRLTTVLRGNTLYYFLAVAPQPEISRYTPTFERMISSIRFY